MSKPKTFRPWNPEQTLLLPPSPVEWLPANHLVFFLLDLAAELDLSAIYAVYAARDPRGVKAYEPRMMVVLLLYAYCVGIPSSRRIERACWEDAAFRVLTGNQQPDHSRISDFRLVHLDALAGLFVQVLRLCQKAGLVSLGNVALDGTKVKANAFKHKAMSHERMLKTKAQLEAEIAALLRKAELIDAQEDVRYGKGKRGDELPKELKRRQDRLDALRKARAELEAEAAADNARRREQQARAAEEQAAEAAVQAADAESAAAAEDKGNSDAESEAAAQALAKEAQQAERRAKAARGRAELARRLAIDKARVAGLSTPDPLISVDPLAMPSRNLPTTAAGVPKANAQRNHRYAEGCAYTDPDSHFLKGGDGWIQGYNCQAAVDGDHQIIVAVGVSNQASDQHHLLPMVERIVANTGQLPEKLIADAGYCSTANIEASEQRGLDAYLSTSRQSHGKRPRPSRGPAPRDLDARGRMDRKLRSKAGQAIYALRKIIAEPVFGQIKGARGLDRFLLRGLGKVDGEWSLMAITHNIGKLHRAALAAS
jgi:transposase